jgi:hypothetical protein
VALAGADPVAREVAARQLARLRSSGRRGSPRSTPSRWRHVPLAELFAEQANRVHHRSDGMLESGHEPVHASRSGRCVLIDPGLGRWWCRSCRKSGDAARLVMELRGCSYAPAAAWLAGRYGPPPGRPGRAKARRRRFALEAVLP